jgi:diketogulonate reductase-like aldo/keto reductase
MEYVTVDNVTLPGLGLGTARMRGETCEQAVARGIEMGYRHLDTAQMYDNEAAVGAGIEASGVDRSEVFMTTKLDRENRSAKAVRSSTAASLDRLGLETVDLLLMHSPNDWVPLAETIGAMNELQSEGRVAHIGVSNFSVDQLREAIDVSETPIVTNQVKYHPYHHQDDLLDFCNKHDVILTAYSPLARGRVADDETLGEIGDRHGKTAVQVALRWLIQQPNVIAIPKAASDDHLRENFEVFDFELTDEEVDRVFDVVGRLVEKVREWLG